MRVDETLAKRVVGDSWDGCVLVGDEGICEGISAVIVRFRVLSAGHTGGKIHRSDA